MNLGLIQPTTYVSRLGRSPLEIRRCMVDDGLLVATSQAHLRRHGGHRVKDPCLLRLWEFIAIQIGIISE